MQKKKKKTAEVKIQAKFIMDFEMFAKNLDPRSTFLDFCGALFHNPNHSSSIED